jgi:hypothetical protein
MPAPSIEQANVVETRLNPTPDTTAPSTVTSPNLYLGDVGSAAGTSAAAQQQPTDADKKKPEDKSFWEKLGTKTEDMLTNPMTLLAGGALLANASGAFGTKDALAGGSTANADKLAQNAAADAAGAKTLTDLANTNVQQGNQLQSYLTSGTLPPGMAAQVEAARQSAIAGATQMYANLGMGAGSTSFMQDMGAINQQAVATTAQIAESLYNSGIQQATLASNLYSEALAYSNADTSIYQNLLTHNLQADQNLSQSVNGFVTALANMGRPQNIIQTTGTTQ